MSGARESAGPQGPRGMLGSIGRPELSSQQRATIRNALAELTCRAIADTVGLRQRLFMPREELIVLLVNAWAKGATMAYDESIAMFRGVQS